MYKSSLDDMEKALQGDNLPNDVFIKSENHIAGHWCIRRLKTFSIHKSLHHEVSVSVVFVV